MLSILNHIAQPALCLQDGKISMCNPAALREGFSLGEALPPVDAGAAFVLERAGRRYSVQALSEEGTLVLLLQPLQDSEVLPPEQIRQICAALRYPLSDLVAAEENLFPYLEEQEDEFIQRSAAQITRASYRLLRAVGLMESTEALRQGTLRLSLKATELCGFLSELFTLTEGICKELEVPVRLELPDRMFVAQVDQTLLERAYYQLLSNALRHCKGSLTIRLEHRGAAAILSFRDDGDGFSPLAMQALGSGGSDSGGLGLGLTFARRVAELHGGSLLVQSQSGEGAAVLFRLPLEPPEDAPRLASEEQIIDYSGGLPHAQLELSDVLPDRIYDSRSL